MIRLNANGGGPACIANLALATLFDKISVDVSLPAFRLSGRESGRAGSRWISPFWLCSNISAIPAAPPKITHQLIGVVTVFSCVFACPGILP